MAEDVYLCQAYGISNDAGNMEVFTANPGGIAEAMDIARSEGIAKTPHIVNRVSPAGITRINRDGSETRAESAKTYCCPGCGKAEFQEGPAITKV